MTTPRARKANAPAMDNAPEPQDRKKPAAQLEAENVETVTIEWDGLEFEIPADPDEWDFWTVVEPLSSNNVVQATLGLLGPKQTLRLRQQRPKIKPKDFAGIFEAINEVIGFGNSGN